VKLRTVVWIIAVTLVLAYAALITLFILVQATNLP
jgi:hypothetical protein